jgi:hypothetical protein
VEHYRKIGVSLDIEERKDMAQEIYHKFLVKDLINLSDRTKTKLHRTFRPNQPTLHHSNLGPESSAAADLNEPPEELSLTTFDQAQREVYGMHA